MIIMEESSVTKKNKAYADFSIETLLRKDDNNANPSRKTWGIVQHANYFPVVPSNTSSGPEESYNFNCVPIDGGEGDEEALETQPEEEDEEELISVSDDNVETNNDKLHRKSDNNEDSSSDSTFAWLTCTRFKPPKLPRPRRKSTSRKLGRGPRIPFSTHQLAVLESTFVKTQYLSSDAIARLAENLNLTETRVKIWFQNRRARFRREKQPSTFSPEFDRKSASTKQQDVAGQLSFHQQQHQHTCSSPNRNSNQKQFRHLINDLNLMAAANINNSKNVLHNFQSYNTGI